MQRLLTSEIDHKTAALLLYALQTASMNLKHTSLEPKLPTRVVIDRQSVARRPLGASAWSKVEGREYDDLIEDENGEFLDPELRELIKNLDPKVLGAGNSG